MVKAVDPTISIKVLQGGVKNHFNYKASYKKISLVKQRVIARIYGDWEESYNELSRWLFTMQILDLVQLTQSCFIGFFWTFLPCIGAFKHCKPLISIDSTHLYGKYGETLLMAIAQDGNANILLIAFAVVEGETKEAWSFFLAYLRQHVKPQPGILVISDRHKSIDAALNVEGRLWKPPHAFQAFCTRYIATNFMTHFKNKNLKKVLVNAVYSKSQREFAHYFGCLRGENAAITNYLEKMPWNDSEALAQLQVGVEFSQMLMNVIEFNSKHVNTVNVYQFDRSRTTFTVEELAAA
ncbi:uncharacterized protein LOC107613201 [Arachis ipaensis]|uniref:uncharacterized protein LOC107613201 n=1 Tax=Arachis ipaensis TaxID=130454 RepID=UPI0007AF8CC1|nr:uncharacterized protein LOC107613201 [Arachis ipaensis]